MKGAMALFANYSSGVKTRRDVWCFNASRDAVASNMRAMMERTDKASGIVNDANRYAIETVGNPAYPLPLFQRMITVSLETMKIVRSLPALDIDSAKVIGE